MDWREELKQDLGPEQATKRAADAQLKAEIAAVNSFFQDTVLPAFSEIDKVLTEDFDKSISSINHGPIGGAELYVKPSPSEYAEFRYIVKGVIENGHVIVRPSYVDSRTSKTEEIQSLYAKFFTEMSKESVIFHFLSIWTDDTRWLQQEQEVNWREKLQGDLGEQHAKKRAVKVQREEDLQQIQTWLASVVVPAFEELRETLTTEYDRQVTVGDHSQWHDADIRLEQGGYLELEYKIYAAEPDETIVARSGIVNYRNRKTDFEVRTTFPKPLSQVTKEDVIHDFLAVWTGDNKWLANK